MIDARRRLAARRRDNTKERQHRGDNTKGDNNGQTQEPLSLALRGGINARRHFAASLLSALILSTPTFSLPHRRRACLHPAAIRLDAWISDIMMTRL
jgi:hypothetical protein